MSDEETRVNNEGSWENQPELLSRIWGGFLQRIASNVAGLLRKKPKEPNFELNGNKDAILNEISEKYVTAKKAVKLNKEWHIVSINLPAVWEFKGYSFNFFISDGGVKREIFESNPIYAEKSKSMDDIVKLLEALRKYMKSRWVEIDRNSEKMRNSMGKHWIMIEEYDNYMKTVDWRKLFYWEYEAVECLMKMMGNYWSHSLRYNDFWLKDVWRSRQVLSFEIDANKGKQGILFFDWYNGKEDCNNLLLDV